MYSKTGTREMKISSHIRTAGVVIVAAGLLLAGCDSGDPEAQKQMTGSGLSEQAASELSRLELSPDEVTSIAEAKKGGLDDASLVQMVKSVHARNLKFDLGFALQVLAQQGIGATVLTQLVDMGALPGWFDSISALKNVGVGDVTILQLAKMKFEEKKELLSGGEYASLKKFGISDAGLLTFAQKGGNYQQVQDVSRELALGKPEQEALKTVGM